MKSGGWTIQTLNLGVHICLSDTRLHVGRDGAIHVCLFTCQDAQGMKNTTTNILQTNHNMAWSAVKDGCVY